MYYEIDEFGLPTYESSYLYKENMNFYHDQKVECREFHSGDLVFLYNLILWFFPTK